MFNMDGARYIIADTTGNDVTFDTILFSGADFSNAYSEYAPILFAGDAINIKNASDCWVTYSVPDS